MNMRLRQAWGTIIRTEWWSFLITIGLPPLVLLISLYGIGAPQDFEIWQYAPPAVPTLAVIESVVMRSSAVQASNPLTVGIVWLITRAIFVPQYVFILLYMLAASLTAAVTYVVARITAVDRMWAMVVALAFTMAPARFWFVDISHHWWYSVPLVWLVVYHWWYQPLGDWRTMYRPTMPLIAIAVLGWEHLVWSGIALTVAAAIAASIRPEWSWRQLGYALAPMAGMALMLSIIVPMPLATPITDGVRLLDLVAPHRSHWAPWLAGLGERLAQLEIPKISTVYTGMLAIGGVLLVVIGALKQLTHPRVGVAQPLFVWLLSLVLLATLNGFGQLWYWVGMPVVSPQLVQLIIVFAGLITLTQWLQQYQRYALYAVAFVLVIVLIDQVPSTNIMHHMRQAPQVIATTQLTDGVWFGQQRLPADVRAVSGLSTIDPGYGRWSDADVADRIRIVLRHPLTTPVTLEIRARGVGANLGVPIVVRIGSDEQTMVLDSTVKPYLLTFNQPQGTVIEIVPQPVTTPPPGDIRRIGIFLQSLRVVTP